MYYYTYKITLLNGSLKDKYYYGRHQTENLDDGYKGSGSILLDYYKKYPNDYKKEILSFYDNYDDLLKGEYNLIKGVLNSDKNNINLRDGGPNSFNGCRVSDCIGEKISRKLKGRILTPEWKEKISNTLKGHTAWNKGKKMSQEQKINSGQPKGVKWMNDGYYEYFVGSDKWGELIDMGATFGRIYGRNKQNPSAQKNIIIN